MYLRLRKHFPLKPTKVRGSPKHFALWCAGNGSNCHGYKDLEIFRLKDHRTFPLCPGTVSLQDLLGSSFTEPPGAPDITRFQLVEMFVSKLIILPVLQLQMSYPNIRRSTS